MKKRYKLLAITVFLLQSCNNRPTFEVINNSNKTLDSITVSITDVKNNKFYNIRSGDKISGSIKFDSTVTGDGSYRLETYMKGVSKTKTFGYYTNGAPLNNHFKIIISNDTILIE